MVVDAYLKYFVYTILPVNTLFSLSSDYSSYNQASAQQG